jgi:hypothetical protein
VLSVCAAQSGFHASPWWSEAPRAGVNQGVVSNARAAIEQFIDLFIGYGQPRRLHARF